VSCSPNLLATIPAHVHQPKIARVPSAGLSGRRGLDLDPRSGSGSGKDRFYMQFGHKALVWASSCPGVINETRIGNPFPQANPLPPRSLVFRERAHIPKVNRHATSAGLGSGAEDHAPLRGFFAGGSAGGAGVEGAAAAGTAAPRAGTGRLWPRGPVCGPAPQTHRPSARKVDSYNMNVTTIR